MTRASASDGNLISDSVERFKRAHPELGIAPATSAGGRHWAEIAELGWLMLPFASSDGGLHERAQDAASDLAALFEGIGYERIDEPVAEIACLAGGLLAGAPEAQLRTDLIDGLVSGRLFVAAALDEASSQDLSHCTCSAREANEGWRLQGVKSMVLGGSAADEFIVLARILDASERPTEDVGLFVVASGSAGTDVLPYRLRDGHWAGDVRLGNVKVGRERLLARGACAQALVKQGLAAMRFAMAAEIVGVSARAVDMSRSFTSDRHQFGQPVARFQVVEHRLVDMTLKVEQLRSLVASATAQIERAGYEGASASIEHCYSAAGTWGVEVLKDAIQLHGGMGMTEELGLGRMLCRAFAPRLLFPT